VNCTLTLVAVLPTAGVGFGATPIFTNVLPPSGVVPYSNPLTQLVVTVVLHRIDRIVESP